MLSGERGPALLMALTVVGWTPAATSFAGEWQVARVRVNGVPLELRRRDFMVPPSALVGAVLSRWDASGVSAPLSSIVGGRTVIGRQRGRLHETVSLTPVGPGRTSVLVSVSDLGARPATTARLPAGLPVGQRVLQLIETGRGHGSERTFTLASDRDPGVALVQWRRALAAAGWSPRVAATGSAAGGGWALWADRGRERLEAASVKAPEGARIVLVVTGDAH